MQLDSGWQSPLVQDGEAADGAASAWFGCEIRSSHPLELFEQNTAVNNFCFYLLSNTIGFGFKKPSAHEQKCCTMQAFKINLESF